MCGICGIIDPGGALDGGELRTIVSNMAARLVHRGPDDLGTWQDPELPVGLGHTRLSIIDLSPAGAQPMTSRDGRFVISYNGEIYNHRELRGLLEKSGASFNGNSDTEVLVEAIALWGLEKTLARISGMFAIALWDRKTKCLTLVRDRFGKKPLYYGWAGSQFVFASELKAIHEVPGFQADVDPETAPIYGWLGYLPAPHSIFCGIRKLVPGSWLKIEVNAIKNQLPEPVRYWAATETILDGVTSRPETATDDTIESLHAELSAAVERRMVADVPLGALLSGGIDSSLVVALMQAQSNEAVRTFSVGFTEAAYDEARFAKAVAAHLQTNHTEILLTPGEAMDVIPGLPSLYDEPFSDSSQIPTYLISRVARQALTVALSGDGGDEVFGGYTRYTGGLRAWRTARRFPEPVRRAFSKLLAALPRTWLDQALRPLGGALPGALVQRRPGDQLHKLARVLSGSSLATYYLSLIALGRDFPGADTVAAVSGLLPIKPGLTSFLDEDWLMASDTVLYMPDDVLTKVDRASMGVSLEVRSPFLDQELFQRAWQLPVSMKFRDGVGKWCLRRILGRYIPKELVERPKTGFGIPLGAWLRGPLRDWVEDLLSVDRLNRSNAVEALGLRGKSCIRETWNQHQSGVRNSEHELWTILMYQAWHEAWVQ